MQNKKWYKSKTVWVAVIQLLLGITIIISSNFPEVGYVAIIKSILDVFMRFVTTLPLE